MNVANLLRRVSHHDVKKSSTLARSKTYDSDLTKLEKRLPVRRWMIEKEKKKKKKFSMIVRTL